MHRLITELVQAREDIGLSRRALAEDMLMDRAGLDRWENGATIPTVPTVERWAYSLGYRLAITTGDGLTHTCLSRIISALVQARRAQDITQAALSDAMGTERTMLGGWERGRRTPTLQTLDDWAAALGYQLILLYRDGGGA